MPRVFAIAGNSTSDAEYADGPAGMKPVILLRR